VSYEGEAASVSFQQTLKGPINCTGIGLHSGSRVGMTLVPAAAGSGINFVRTDLLASGRGLAEATVPARWDAVVDTRLCTVVGNATGVTVGTVEHLMSALRGCGIDNLTVELDGPEVPVMDGSAAPFVFLVECSGIQVQDQPRRLLRVLKEVSVVEGEKSAVLTPAAAPGFSFEIDFDSAVVRRQEGHLRLTASSFKAEVARARTFGFLHEVDMMRRAGLARGGSLDNAIVISGDRVMNEGGLRYKDEFVRHKILDAVGDLYLAGAPILGHYSGIRAGHALNNKLLRALFADASAWRLEEPVAPASTADGWTAPRLAASA